MTGLNSSKVILVQPPIQDYYLTKKRTIPYGLAILAADLRRHGFDPEIIDGLASSKSRPAPAPAAFGHLDPFYAKKDISLFSLFSQYMHYGYSLEHIATRIRDKKPFLVGISSLFTAYSDMALNTAAMIKQWCPDTIVVMGGHHPTRFGHETVSHPAVDFVVAGEGENVFARLCLALKNGQTRPDIPGVIGSHSLQGQVSPHWVENLSDLPLPAVDLVNQKFYRRHRRHTAVVVSSRGCPMPCSYCAVASTSGHAPYRRRPVQDVVGEIKVQLDHEDIGFIDFEDENLCLNKTWFRSLFAQLIPMLEGRNIELRAMNGLYPPSLDEEVIAILKKAGFNTLNLSVGSMQTDQLHRFHRPDIRASFKKALKLAAFYHMECVSYLIAGAPQQTAQSSLNDLLVMAGKRTLVGLSIFYPAPGSLDFQWCKDKGLLPAHVEQMRSSAFPIEDTTSRLEAVTLLRLSRILNFMKTLADQQLLPVPPEPCAPDPVHIEVTDRFAASLQLLKCFLHDGIIRGVSPSGEVFPHLCDTALTREFIEQITTITVRGVK
jgi:anaerobic magnesium-protoporphyrin IX monomethyl ester cyclase